MLDWGRTMVQPAEAVTVTVLLLLDCIRRVKPSQPTVHIEPRYF